MKGARRGKDTFKRCEQRPGDKWVWQGSSVARSLAWVRAGGQQVRVSAQTTPELGAASPWFPGCVSHSCVSQAPAGMLSFSSFSFS